MMSNENEKSPHVPNNHVLAVLDGTLEMERLAHDVVSSGHEHTILFQGEELVDTVDAKGEKSSIVSKLFKGIQEHLSEEPNYLAQYQEEARRGHPVVAIPVKDNDDALTVGELLQRYNARNVRHFGSFAVTDLTPNSNPSLRSDESAEVQEHKAASS